MDSHVAASARVSVTVYLYCFVFFVSVLSPLPYCFYYFVINNFLGWPFGESNTVNKRTREK